MNRLTEARLEDWQRMAEAVQVAPRGSAEQKLSAATLALVAEVRRLQRYEAYVLRLQRNCERAISPENHAPHYMMEATIKAEAQTMLEDIRALLAEEA